MNLHCLFYIWKHLPNLMYSQSYSTVSLTCDDEEFQAQLIIDIWTGISPFQFILLIFISYLCSACNFDLHYVILCVWEIWHLFETLDKDHTNTLHCSSVFALKIYIIEKRIIIIIFYNMMSEKRVRCFVNMCYSN